MVYEFVDHFKREKERDAREYIASRRHGTLVSPTEVIQGLSSAHCPGFRSKSLLIFLRTTFCEQL
jgi:hypothetical protein